MHGRTLSGAVKCVVAWLHLVHAWQDLVWCNEVCCGLVTSGTRMAGPCLVQRSVLWPGYNIWYMHGRTLSGAVKCVVAWLHMVHAWQDLVWCSEVCCGLVTSGTRMAGPCLVQRSVLWPGYIWYTHGRTLSGAVKCAAAWLQMTKPCQAVPSCSSNIWYMYHVTLLRVAMCNVLQSGHK